MVRTQDLRGGEARGGDGSAQRLGFQWAGGASCPPPPDHATPAACSAPPPRNTSFFIPSSHPPRYLQHQSQRVLLCQQRMPRGSGPGDEQRHETVGGDHRIR